MTLRRSITLWNPHQAYAEILRLWPEVKNYLIAGHRLELSVRPSKRSDAANARLHALLSDIAQQKQWAGQWLDVEDWKRLCTSAWLRTRNQSVRMLPAIDGQGIDILYQRTSELSGAEVSELMSFVEAWGVENGVEFKEPAAA